jgi:acyl-coenzyme A synthetase/AMP-(fatty) acid ligase
VFEVRCFWIALFAHPDNDTTVHLGGFSGKKEGIMERPWFDHYEEGVPVTFEYPEQPIYDLLEDTARTFPKRAAILFLGTKISYQGLADLIHRFATAIHSMGVQKGDRVACILPNCPQFIISYYGVMRAGAVFVQMNPLNSEKEIQFQLADSGAETNPCQAHHQHQYQGIPSFSKKSALPSRRKTAEIRPR